MITIMLLTTVLYASSMSRDMPITPSPKGDRRLFFYEQVQEPHASLGIIPLSVPKPAVTSFMVHCFIIFMAEQFGVENMRTPISYLTVLSAVSFHIQDLREVLVPFILTSIRLFVISNFEKSRLAVIVMIFLLDKIQSFRIPRIKWRRFVKRLARWFSFFLLADCIIEGNGMTGDQYAEYGLMCLQSPSRFKLVLSNPSVFDAIIIVIFDQLELEFVQSAPSFAGFFVKNVNTVFLYLILRYVKTIQLTLRCLKHRFYEAASRLLMYQSIFKLRSNLKLE